jgi:hypothetical protein
MELDFIHLVRPSPSWEDHLAFTEATGLKWQAQFGKNLHWKASRVFSAESRSLLETLSPPFYPEDELIIWDPGVDGKKPPATTHVSKVVSRRLTLDDGFLFSTEFRLIWGNKHMRTVCQVQYKEIQTLVWKSQAILILQLQVDESVEIHIRTPKPNQSTARRLLSFSFHATMQDAKESGFDARQMLTTFFEAIIAENTHKKPLSDSSGLQG